MRSHRVEGGGVQGFFRAYPGLLEVQGGFLQGIRGLLWGFLHGIDSVLQGFARRRTSWLLCSFLLQLDI